jgi:hypothetical protein
MKTHELIENLREADPDGEAEVWIYIHRRYGGHQALAYEAREFRHGEGTVYITDEQDPET